MAPQPCEVAFDRICSDKQTVMGFADTLSGQVTFKGSTLIQHGCVDHRAWCTSHVPRTGFEQEGLSIRALNLDLAERRDVEYRGTFVGSHDFGTNILKPVRPTEGHGRLGYFTEIQRSLPAEELPHMRARRLVFLFQWQGSQSPGREKLFTRICDVVMRPKYLRRTGHQVINVVEHRRKALGVSLRQVVSRMAVYDAMGQVHACATTRCNSDRVHATPKKKPLGFSGLSEHESAIGGETLRPVQQHFDFGRFQRRQPVQRVHHHRFEVIPILGQQTELECLVQYAGGNRLAQRLETPDQKPTTVVADVEMAVMVGKRWHITSDAIDRLGQKVEMFTGERRHLGPRHCTNFARPKPSAKRDRLTHHCALRGLNALDPAVLGQDACHTSFLEQLGPQPPCGLNQRGTDIRGTDPPVIR